MKSHLKELIYALLPYSFHQKLVRRKCYSDQDADTFKENLIAMYPPSLDFRKVIAEEIDKSIAFLPYCAKPLGDIKCPLIDSDLGRKNQKCIKLTNGKCNVPCSLGQMIDVLKEYGFTRDRIFIMDSESNLLPWLKQKRKEGYKYFFPGVGCYYGVGRALDSVTKTLGYEGCIIFLEDYDPSDPKNGVCKCMHDYLNMEKKDKGKKTRISENSIKQFKSILQDAYLK